MTKQEYEIELKAMQEKRREISEVWLAGRFFSGEADVDKAPGPCERWSLDKYLDRKAPLPVWVEPQPVVKGPSGAKYTVRRTSWDARPVFALSSESPKGTASADVTILALDLHAVVLALLGPEGVAEFYARIAEATWPNLNSSRAPAILARVSRAYPQLVALAEKEETP